MKLDLSTLSKLRTDTPQKPQKSPFKPILPKGDNNTPTNSKKTEIKGLYELQRMQTEQARYKAVCKEYQQNIKTSELLQTDILKGARAGEDIYSLFLKAVKAISLMTANSLFYSQLEGDIKTIYGKGLLHAPALQIELREVEARTVLLKGALERETERDNIDRIKRAIVAHQSKRAELEALIKRADSRAS